MWNSPHLHDVSTFLSFFYLNWSIFLPSCFTANEHNSWVFYIKHLQIKSEWKQRTFSCSVQVIKSSSKCSWTRSWPVQTEERHSAFIRPRLWWRRDNVADKEEIMTPLCSCRSPAAAMKQRQVSVNSPSSAPLKCNPLFCSERSGFYSKCSNILFRNKQEKLKATIREMFSF